MIADECGGEGESPLQNGRMLRTCFASGFPVRLDCVRRANGATPASVALIQSLNQFLNQRTQLRGVTFICHRSTKFAPVPLHAVSHMHLRYSGANAAVVGSMFGATTLSGSIASSSQYRACSFHLWVRNIILGHLINRLNLAADKLLSELARPSVRQEPQYASTNGHPQRTTRPLPQDQRSASSAGSPGRQFSFRCGVCPMRIAAPICPEEGGCAPVRNTRQTLKK